jgi:tetratricopeptide (TPR) repeat protein
VVREAAGVAAYRAGEWAEAIAELRTARRLTGDSGHLPLIADSERALGRPERALALARSAEVAALPPAQRAEMRIVESGARRDLGQLDAALVALQGTDLDRAMTRPWSARLWYAYAETLLALGRAEQAREWFLGAASVDADGATDATERLLELDGVTLIDDEDDDDNEVAETDTGAWYDGDRRVASDPAGYAGLDRGGRVTAEDSGQAAADTAAGRPAADELAARNRGSRAAPDGGQRGDADGLVAGDQAEVAGTVEGARGAAEDGGQTAGAPDVAGSSDAADG